MKCDKSIEIAFQTTASADLIPFDSAASIEITRQSHAGDMTNIWKLNENGIIASFVRQMPELCLSIDVENE